MDVPNVRYTRSDGVAIAYQIVKGAKELSLEVRAGIHTGECEIVGEKIAGIAVVAGGRRLYAVVDG